MRTGTRRQSESFSLPPRWLSRSGIAHSKQLLAALDEEANPAYDKALAQRLVNLGAEVGAMTPGELAAWVGEKVS